MKKKYLCPACGSNTISVWQKLKASHRTGIECPNCHALLFKRKVWLTSVFDGLLYLSFFFFLFLSLFQVSVLPLTGFIFTIALFEWVKLVNYPLTTVNPQEFAGELGRKFARAIRKIRN